MALDRACLDGKTRREQRMMMMMMSGMSGNLEALPPIALTIHISLSVVV